MPRYTWEGRTSTGSVVRGEMDAPSRDVAAQRLHSQRITVTRVEGPDAGEAPGPATSPPPPSRLGRPGSSVRETLFMIAVCGGFALLGVGAAWIDPVLFFDCARQANGSVDCTVHRRMYGVIPRGDLHFSRIQSVEVKSGVHSETMSERTRRIRMGGQESSYEVLQLTCADGTRWDSPESSWPMGQTLSDHRAGIQGLINADSPGTYRGWTGEKVTLTIAIVFFAPTGFVLLGLVLRLVMPRSAVEALRRAAEAAAARRRAAGRP